MSIYFEKVSKYNNWDLPMPERKTKYSAGYDFASAEDVVIPSYLHIIEAFKNYIITLKDNTKICFIDEACGIELGMFKTNKEENEIL